MKTNKVFVILATISLFITSAAWAKASGIDLNHVRINADDLQLKNIRPPLQLIGMKESCLNQVEKWNKECLNKVQAIAESCAENPSFQCDQQFDQMLYECEAKQSFYAYSCEDADADGIPNDRDAFRCDPDHDHNGIVDKVQLDQNSNGTVDEEEGQSLPWGYDSDGDGISDRNDLSMCDPAVN